VKWACPHLQYIATDFDKHVIDACRHVALLHDIDKGVIDARGDLPLADVDLALAWAVEYALDDDELRGLIGDAAAKSVPLLICSTSVTGPVAATIHTLRRRWGHRTHGRARSLAWFHAFAREAGVRLDVLGRSGRYWFLMFTPPSHA
jgi:hypothetical protein